jgi:hypothetical protein
MRLFLFGILMSLSMDVAAAVPRVDPIPLASLPVGAPFGYVDLARLDDQLFLSVGSDQPLTVAALYRQRLPIIATGWERLTTPPIRPTALRVHDGVLYVCGAGEEVFGTSDSHALIRSTDAGLHWQAIDAGLEERIRGYHRYLACTELLVLPDGALLSNPGGGRSIAIKPVGQPWRSLTGGLVSEVCYAGVLAWHDGAVLTGGECALDVAYLERGVLKADGSAWQTPLADMSGLDLQNRNVQFIDTEAMPVFVGVEGGLLRGPASGPMEFVIEHSSGGDRYPYIRHLLRGPPVLVAAGFDKASSTSWLAVSEDEGDTWVEVPCPGNEVAALLRLDDRRIVAAIVDHTDWRLDLHLLDLGDNRRIEIRSDSLDTTWALEPGDTGPEPIESGTRFRGCDPHSDYFLLPVPMGAQ